jgi:hypothetical protein
MRIYDETASVSSCCASWADDALTGYPYSSVRPHDQTRIDFGIVETRISINELVMLEEFAAALM